jgi:hypothetical protein
MAVDNSRIRALRLMAPPLTSPVRRGQAEAAAAVEAAAERPWGVAVAAVAAAVGRTLRGARGPQRQASLQYAACGGLILRQRRTSVPPRLRRLVEQIKSKGNRRLKVNTTKVLNGSTKVGALALIRAPSQPGRLAAIATDLHASGFGIPTWSHYRADQ